MDLKELVQTGISSRPPRILIFGPHGIGKSTFGASAPAPIFLPTEDGLTTIDIPHFPVATALPQVWEAIGALIKENHDYKTFVVDTLDWLEKLIWSAVCEEHKTDAIEGIGYGKGYNYALTHWDRFIRGLDKLRDKGMAVVLLAHSSIQTYNPPDNTPYDRHAIKLHKTASAKIEEWCDAVLFVNYRVFVKTEKGKSSGKATGGERILYTSPNPAYKTKNRYGLPEEVDFNFNTLLKEMKNG